MDVQQNTIKADACQSFIGTVLASLGADAGPASRWAEMLVETSLLGIDSHGIRMLDRYVQHIDAGGIDVSAKPTTLRDEGSCLCIDGHQGLGHLAADYATNIAVERAERHGISCVTAKNCNHTGACGVYVRHAALNGHIGICTTVSKALMAPWGGKEQLIGVSPIAVAAPIANRPPFLFDAATSVTAMGKVTMAADHKQSIPDGWALDGDGNPTTDPLQARQGSLLPIGTYKGYALAMSLEILAAVLSGGLFAHDVPSWIKQPEDPMGGSFTAIAINIAAFLDVSVFKERLDEWMETLTQSSRRDGFQRIYYPGEMEAETYALRSKSGIPVDTFTAEAFQRLAARFGVPSIV